ncbi:MAG TPA: hypothetical protein VGJ00_01930 [Rhabdochlamydiaceae bacterium]|jgi:hypothetical protein
MDNPFSIPFADSPFSPALFFQLAQQSSSFLSNLFSLPAEAELSYCFDLSVIQDSFRFRALRRARALAHYLIDDKGEWDKARLDHLLQEMHKTGYIFYPNAFNDGATYEFMLRILKQLSENTTLVKALMRFQKPICHKWAERLVLDSLGLYHAQEIKDAHIKRAALCACLTPLRQSVGSCFASAPAIVVQREQTLAFLEDLYQLLTTGKLKRTFSGREYSAPLCPNYGVGDLRKNLLLSDIKAMSWFSPGLIAACESMGLIDSALPYGEKIHILKSYLSQFTEGKRTVTAEELIRFLLLQQMQISEDDLRIAEQILHMQHKTMRLTPLMAEGGTSKRVEKHEQFQKKEKESKAAFMGLCDNALLKAWEFTLASFTDVKMEFSSWNLYHSLGFDEKQLGGLGELIYAFIDERLKKINEKITEFNHECQAAFAAMKATEGLLRNADSETQARRLQAEYQSRAYHMRSCLEIRDKFEAQGEHYANLFNFLLKHYATLFPEYFQEIYDPQMLEAQSSVYEDSLAGFRLVYKHGRQDPILWTLIYDEATYIDCLSDFFSMAEGRIAVEITYEEGKKDLAEITTALLNFVRTESFMQGAVKRVAQKEHSGKPHKEKKPWAYLSGGTVDTLLKTYFTREGEYTKEEKWVDNESELLIFIADALKGLTPLITDPYLANPDKGMLITSPTHAFILLPGQKKLAEGWQDNGFTYTWVRDQVFLPSQHFYSQMLLSTTQQLFLFDQFCHEIPPLLIHALHQAWHVDNNTVSVPVWRNKILEALFDCADAKHPFQRSSLTDGLDAFLFQVLPIVPGSDWKQIVRRLLSDLYDDACRDFISRLNEVPSAYMTAKKIKELAKACYVYSRGSLFSSFDIHQYIADHARFIGLAPPSSLVFADTNWSNFYFGFVVNPGTERFDMWSLDRTASQGTPLSDWKYLPPGVSRAHWAIYTRPSEYTSSPQSQPLGHRV